MAVWFRVLVNNPDGKARVRQILTRIRDLHVDRFRWEETESGSINSLGLKIPDVNLTDFVGVADDSDLLAEVRLLVNDPQFRAIGQMGYIEVPH